MEREAKWYCRFHSLPIEDPAIQDWWSCMSTLPFSPLFPLGAIHALFVALVGGGGSPLWRFEFTLLLLCRLLLVS